MDESDESILLAVRQGDLKLLDETLSMLPNPDKYLNRTYDERNMQKCTLLTTACLNRHYDIVQTLVDSYTPDLEVKNNILFGDGKCQQMCFDVTVLWVAAAINNLDMVKLLIEHGAMVNQTTKTNSTALRSACYNGNVDMARYLIENGADVNIAKENNDTNLAVSVYQKHLKMAAYLVDELGCNVNTSDNDGRPPLYDAVNCGSLELVQFLLDRNARNFPAKCDQMTPLMWAAEKRRTSIVDAISPHCSLIEQIEAEELLGSAFACAELEERDFEKCFEHFSRALNLRLAHSIPKVLKQTTSELFNNQQECQTIEQLQSIKSDSSRISIEALLVRERILGPQNPEYRYSLRYHGAILADDHEHHQAIAFWMYELGLRQKYSIDMDSENLRHFVSMFSEMVYLSSLVPIQALLTIIRVLIEELKRDAAEFDFNLHTLLFLITITSQLFAQMNVSIIDRREIYRCFYSVIKKKYVTKVNGSSLLHLSLNGNTLADDFFIDRNCKYPCLLTVRTLLKCGADVNEPDTIRNTSLHEYLCNSFANDPIIIEFLCNAGAHLDYTNALKETIIDVASSKITKKLLKSKLRLSLKCLCAQLIQHRQVPFHGKLSSTLVHFIERH